MTNTVSLTERAKERIASLMETNNENTLFFCVNSKGCGGNGYQLGFIERDEVETSDDIIDLGDDRLFVVDNGSAALLLGTVVDWQDQGVGGSFTFSNPQAAGSCGCGSSFHTEKACS